MSSHSDDHQPPPAMPSVDESEPTPASSSPISEKPLARSTTTGAAVSGSEQAPPPAPSSTHRRELAKKAAQGDAEDPAVAHRRTLECGWSLAPIHSFDRSIPVPPELLSRSHPPRSATDKDGGIVSPPKSGGRNAPQYGRVPLPPIASGTTSPGRSSSTPRTAALSSSSSPTGSQGRAATKATVKAQPSKEMTEAKHLALMWLEEKKLESRASSRSGNKQFINEPDTGAAEMAASPPWANASGGGAPPTSTTSPRHMSPLSALLAKDGFSVTPANPSGLFEGPKGYAAPLSYQERIHQSGKLSSAPFHLSSSHHHSGGGGGGAGSRPPTRDVPPSRSSGRRAA